jgi:hypothetical protein
MKIQAKYVPLHPVQGLRPVLGNELLGGAVGMNPDDAYASRLPNRQGTPAGGGSPGSWGPPAAYSHNTGSGGPGKRTRGSQRGG